MEIKPAPSEVRPVCPSCKKDLDHVWEKHLGPTLSLFGSKSGNRVLICPHCRVWLGQSPR